MKLSVIVINLIFCSSAFAETYRCANFEGAKNMVITVDSSNLTATVNDGHGDRPYVVSHSNFARNQASSKNAITFEGTMLVDTGKVVTFSPDDLSASFYSLDLLTNEDTTIGPVTCVNLSR